jgi:CheY-like chemotaxis protein
LRSGCSQVARMRVLIVDDEPTVRKCVCAILEREGHEPIEAEDAAEALHIARQQACQLVITDCIMPGISGPELVAELKSREYPARYLLISAYEPERDFFGTPFLGKPFTPRQLLAAIEKLESEAARPHDLPCDLRKAEAAWLAAIKEQRQIIEDLPDIPETDGSLLVTKAGMKRRAAYGKYKGALDTDRDSLKHEPGPSSSPPENSSQGN